MGRDADTHIRVTEDVWSELNAKKKPGDSFNDVIERLLDERDADDRDADADTDAAETDGGEPVFAD